MGGSGLADAFQQGENLGGDFVGGFAFDAVGAKPGFVAAEVVLCGGGEVTVAAVSEFDGEGIFEGTASFDVETNLGEHFKWNRGDGQVPNAKGLHDGGDGIIAGVSGGQCAMSVGDFVAMKG